MINENKYRVIGLMSGTSLDGVDLAFITFTKNKTWNYELGPCKTITYPKIWKKKLNEVKQLKSFKKLDEEYGEYLSHLIKYFINKNKIKVDLISSHGHTIFHDPNKKTTLQIGSGKIIAKKTKLLTICDFRSKDVKLGGQGAPLVPIGDNLLFNQYKYCLNLGGFSNISFKKNNLRLAYDICPVNIVLNNLSQKMNFSFDKNGNLAKSGKLNFELLKKLNSLEFYKKKGPKSLGREWVEKKIYPILRKYKNIEDILRTFTEHSAIQIASNLNKGDCLVTGGGTHNKFLIKRIKKLSDCKIHIPNKELIDFKEAMVFGLIGVLKHRNEVNCLKSVTGAKKDSSSGLIFNPY